MRAEDAARHGAELVPWDTFLARARWKQGEHVSIVGPTGGGKTTCALALLPQRHYITALATKPQDSDTTMERLCRTPGWAKVRDWPPPYPPTIMPRVVVWPKVRRMDDIRHQAEVIQRTLRAVFTEGRQCVFADELVYLVKTLGCKTMLELIWTQGRSLGLSLLGCTQRPAWVPLEFYSQATHLVSFRQADRRDLDRMAGIGEHDPARVRHLVKTLGQYQFLYLNTRTGDLLVSTTPPPGG